MTTALTITCPLPALRPGQRPRRPCRARPAAPLPPHAWAGRVPRISKLMALALRFEELVRSGVVADYAALARLGHVSRARISQIVNLLNLAPDLQELLLFLPPCQRGRAPIHLHQLQPLAAIPDWSQQRRWWQALAGKVSAARTGSSPSTRS
jgi:hypothetical protein